MPFADESKTKQNCQHFLFPFSSNFHLCNLRSYVPPNEKKHVNFIMLFKMKIISGSLHSVSVHSHTPGSSAHKSWGGCVSRILSIGWEKRGSEETGLTGGCWGWQRAHRGCWESRSTPRCPNRRPAQEWLYGRDINKNIIVKKGAMPISLMLR